MTSSLVGSEMCIRDSPWMRFSYRRTHPWRWAMLAGLPVFWIDRQATPVSYTHLTLPTICSV
eukprot:404507-Prorocentrum_lima.AAC.1